MKKETLTLLIDEAEDLGTKSERSDALREILNAGYRVGQFVLRCEGSDGKYEPKRYSTYCPKVLVLIGNLSDTLADRCIPIAMRRRQKGEQIERFFVSRSRWAARSTQKQIGEWAKANQARVKRCYQGKDLSFLEDREAELWMPLFAVCRVVAPERLEQLKSIALTISHNKQNEEPAEFGVLLLRDIREAFRRAGKDRLASSDLIMDLKTFEESPWLTWSNGKGLDPRGLARLLRPFRIEPHNLRFNGMIAKGYERADFEEAWATYLPAESTATPLQDA